MLAVLLCGANIAAARPAEDASIAEAKQHYMSGMAHFNLQEYAQAIAEFEAAYRLKPDPVFLYNLGQTYRLSNNAERALYFYKAYLRSAPDAPNRAEVEGRIANLEKLMSDQKSIATPPDHTLEPSEKPAPAEQPAATAPATQPATVAATKSAPAPERTPVYKRWWLWTAVGVVVAGAAVGIAVGLTESSSTFNPALGTVGPAALRGNGQGVAIRVRY